MTSSSLANDFNLFTIFDSRKSKYECTFTMRYFLDKALFARTTSFMTSQLRDVLFHTFTHTHIAKCFILTKNKKDKSGQIVCYLETTVSVALLNFFTSHASIRALKSFWVVDSMLNLWPSNSLVRMMKIQKAYSISFLLNS